MTYLEKMKDNENYVNGMCDLTGVANNLWTLSNAFKRTGNEQVAEELMDYHNRIFEGVDKIEAGVKELRE